VSVTAVGTSRDSRAGQSLGAVIDDPRSSRDRRLPAWFATVSPFQWVLFGILGTIVLAAVFADVVAPYDPTLNDLRAKLAPPVWQDGGSASHLLGTDQLGRDMLSRIVHGSRISLSIALLGTLGGAAIGALAGVIAGYRRGIFDDLLMLIVDAYISLPFIVIALAAIAVFGSSFAVITGLAALSGLAGYTRIARALALQVAQEQYILAARALGASHWRLMLRHAIPNLAAPLIVLATMEMSSIILLEASLSFLGFGIQPPTPAWGLMVNEGRDYLSSAWWVGVPPGLAIMLLAICISLLGDWLRDVLDPRTRRQ
jgi:peptide/nickel transport system permease protein